MFFKMRFSDNIKKIKLLSILYSTPAFYSAYRRTDKLIKPGHQFYYYYYRNEGRKVGEHETVIKENSYIFH